MTMEDKNHVKDLMESRIPSQIREGLKRYIEHGIRPGHFLQSVLTNDLFGACRRADPQCAIAIFDIVMYVSSFAPMDSYGSIEEFEGYIDRMQERRKRIRERNEIDKVKEIS